MYIVLKNGKYAGDYPDNQDMSDVTLKPDEQVIVIPNKVFYGLKEAYQQAGHNTETGLFDLPDPRTVLAVPEQLQQIKKKTASYNRRVKESEGVAWNEYRFRTDTDTCQSLSTAIIGMQTGKITTATVPWRDADGKFVDLTLAQLEEVVEIVMKATEANFEKERAEIAA